MEASDKTALEAVMSVNEEKTRLEAKAEQLNTMEGPEVEQLLIDIYEKCGSFDNGGLPAAIPWSARSRSSHD